MKAKGYWPSASTDEPQVLALAELLKDARISREADALLGVRALAKTEAGRRFDFRPTPAALCDSAVAVKRTRLAAEVSRVPTGVNEDGTWFDSETGDLARETDLLTGETRIKRIVDPERREYFMALIRKYLGEDVPIDQPVANGTAGDAQWDTRTDARSDIGAAPTAMPNITRLSVETRRVGVPDTEDEMVQYRWAFEPPDHWKCQPSCGPWVNSHSEAVQYGRQWLNTANRKYR